MTDSIAIDIKGLTKSFSNGWLGRKQVLGDLNFQILDNEVFGYLGGNGAGKTTTFKLMLGLIRPDKGDIFFWGCPAKDKISRAMIGYLPEQPYFYAYLTGAEALDFYASLFGMTGAERKKRVGYLLDLVGVAHARDTQLRKFSRGMLQRIGIAQALVNDPKLLILDEPMSGLDPMGRKAMRDIILSCRDQGKTIIFSSHIISDVEMICDRAGILANGELKSVISMDDAMSSKDSTWEITCQGGRLDLSGIEGQSRIKQVIRGTRHIVSTGDKDTADRIMETIKNQKLTLVSFSTVRKSIEDIYLANTGQNAASAGSKQG
ncbi:ABC transporter ATP-binding protein [Desulfobacter sp.]|uniref:ABC transporter ATP-binding protein n=1 Tax=Desulfobacter sp. TaxID=2294 RepID=UPI003D151BF5